MKTGIVICSYNMPEYTDALVEHIQECVKLPYELVVFDNGSDKVPPSKHTTHSVKENIQMVPGFMRALENVSYECDYYWLITTSCRFDKTDTRDPLDVLLPIFIKDSNAYAIQPSMNIDYGAWKELLEPRTPPEPRRVWALESIAAIFRASMFNELGRWNENLTRGWGIGSENYFLARKRGWHIYTHDGYCMNKDTFVGYEMGRMNETGEERSVKATEECDREFIPKYGEDYLDFLNWSYRETGRGEY